MKKGKKGRQIKTINEVFSVLTPPNKLKVSEWAEQKRYIAPGTSPEPGKWRNSRCPWAVKMMDAVHRPGITFVILKTGSQMSKTEVLLNICGHAIEEEPRSMLFFTPTIDSSEYIAKQRFNPMVRETPTLSQLIADEKSRSSGNTITHKSFPGGFLDFGGANSPTGLAMRAVGLLLVDELDRMAESAGAEGDPFALMLIRTEEYTDRKIVVSSTPLLRGTSHIDKLFELSDQNYYHVACPHCDHKAPIEWGDLGESYDLKNRGFTLYYKGKNTNSYCLDDIALLCPKCDRPISQAHQRKMVAEGDWVPMGQVTDHAGFTINALYSPRRKWENLARKYEKARLYPETFKPFINTILGLSYDTASSRLSWQLLKERSRSSNYRSHCIPEKALLLISGVDVQGDRLEFSLWGFGEGEESWLICRERIIGDPLQDEVWNQLLQLLNRSWVCQSQAIASINACAVDSGFLTQDVYFQLHRISPLAQCKLYPVKGNPSPNRSLVSQPQKVEINRQGKQVPNSLKRFSIGTETAKETIMARLKVDKPGPKFINLPQDVSDEECQELCSEIQVKSVRAGVARWVWKRIPEFRNELLDMLVYSLAIANVHGLRRIDWPFEAKKRADSLVAEIPPKAPANPKRKNWANDY